MCLYTASSNSCRKSYKYGVSTTNPNSDQAKKAVSPGWIVPLLGPEEGVAPHGEVVAGGPGDQVVRVLSDELTLGALQASPLHPAKTES